MGKREPKKTPRFPLICLTERIVMPLTKWNLEEIRKGIDLEVDEFIFKHVEFEVTLKI